MQNALAHAESDQDIADIIRAIPQSVGYRRKCLEYGNLETRSLMPRPALAFLHELIEVTGAESVLEIGTYFAGATKVLASAVQGRGIVLSIDSNSARAPYVEREIASWPEPLREATMFLPYSAADLFATFQRKEEFWFDLCIVDGDHRHTAALADLLNAARFAGPSAVILVDDSTQPPVFKAVQDFLRLAPEWREVGGAIAGYDEAEALDTMRPSFDGLPFLVLVGPDHPEIGARPHAVGREVLGPVTGMFLDLAEPAPGGRLQTRISLSYIADEKPQLVSADVAIEVPAGARRVAVLLKAPLVPQGPGRVDAFLFWHGDIVGTTLSLASPPSILTAPLN